MIDRIVCVLFTLTLAACGGHVRGGDDTTGGQGFTADPRPLGRTLVYECADYEFIARLGPGEMAVWLDDRYFILSQVRSASGVKYEEGATVFWLKGEEATLELDGQRYTSCRLNPARAPWEDARRRGVNFRGFGNEPGWHLEIQHGRQILFVGDYGMQRVMIPDPGVQVDGATRSYHGRTEASELRVEIIDGLCRDTMKGDEFPSQVSVQYRGRVYRGCGRDLEIPWK